MVPAPLVRRAPAASATLAAAGVTIRINHKFLKDLNGTNAASDGRRMGAGRHILREAFQQLPRRCFLRE